MAAAMKVEPAAKTINPPPPTKVARTPAQAVSAMKMAQNT